MNDEIVIRTRFLTDVAEHTMDILHDDGVFRHLQFSKDKSSVYAFALTTWPGHLCISGDMGCFVFRRLPDMFEFFRNDASKEDLLTINTYYWTQKLVAVDRVDNYRQFSIETFQRNILDYYKYFYEDSPEKFQEVSDELYDEVFNQWDDYGQEGVIHAATEFSYDGRGISWSDIDTSFYVLTMHYTWCLYAITWGIRQYDKYKSSAA